MRRRTFLAATSGAVLASAGCLGRGADADYTPPPRVENPPSGVYRPTASVASALVDTADAGPFRLALLYSYPTRFWEVVGEQTYLRDAADDDSVHLMALAWDPETGVVFPEVGLTVEVAHAEGGDGHEPGDLVAEEAVYAMLSQGLGFHYGDNVALPGDGTYAVTVAVGGLQVRRTGAFAGRFGTPASHTFTVEYAREERDELATREQTDAGEPGAVAPLVDLPVPTAVAPDGDSSWTDLGRTTVADAVFVARLLEGDAAARFDTERYLALTVRTPYNRLLLPAMGLRLRVVREGATAFEEILTRTMDPALHYHYGTAIPALEPADELVVETMTPPQVARHDGYETAFLDIADARLTV
ncbi:iron transporter [Halomarina salina]|uniref:Iron transporter n=1 Tax=Halomarina salina TaxID=1872699 RepID=A0ABD5RKZ8_9EURY|nr:iron transporter [Halomarina salina]